MESSSIKRRWSDSSHTPNPLRPLSRTLSDAVPTTDPPRSFHRRYTSLITFDTVSSGESSDSFANVGSGDRSLLDFELSTNTAQVVPRYPVFRHAGGLAADQRAAIWWRRASGEHLLPALSSSNKMDVAVRTHLERCSNANIDTSSSALEASCSSKSNVTGLEYSNSSQPGPNTNSTESVKKSQHKSPARIERKRERQRLARRAKRAAKALHRGQKFSILDNIGASENTEESVQEGKSQEVDFSPSDVSEVEIDELQWSLRFGKLALGASHESELERVKQLFEKQTEKDVRIINRFLEEWVTEAQVPVRFFFGSS
ncbi:hypothetical protein BDR22DRAFT_978017 [Usnea florida]